MVGARMNKIKKVKSLHGDIGKPLKEKKKLLSRRKKKMEIAIVTRRDQPTILKGKTVSVSMGDVPYFLKVMEVTALARQDIPLQRVSSSWIKELGYHKKERFAVMTTLQGYGYYVKMPWKIFMQWYFAHSKGTFFNYFVKKKYKITRYR